MSKAEPTSVQSLSRRTVVSVGLMFIVFSSIKLFKELPPVCSRKKIKDELSDEQTVD